MSEGKIENLAALAVLIDADNAQPSIVDGLLIEIANYGTASVKRSTQINLMASVWSPVIVILPGLHHG